MGCWHAIGVQVVHAGDGRELAVGPSKERVGQLSAMLGPEHWAVGPENGASVGLKLGLKFG